MDTRPKQLEDGMQYEQQKNQIRKGGLKETEDAMKSNRTRGLEGDQEEENVYAWSLGLLL